MKFRGEVEMEALQGAPEGQGPGDLFFESLAGAASSSWSWARCSTSSWPTSSSQACSWVGVEESLPAPGPKDRLGSPGLARGQSRHAQW